MPRSKDGRWTRICEVCGEEFQALRTNQRTCPLPKPCRARLPHNTGGSRAKAGLTPRICQNPECGIEFIPVRENQIAHTHACLLKCPSYIEAQRRTGRRPGRRQAQNQRRRLDGFRGYEERPCEVCGLPLRPRIYSQTTHRGCYVKRPDRMEAQRANDTRPERRERKNERRRTDPAQAALVRAANRRNNLKRRGLVLEDYDRMFAAQDGKCMICHQPYGGGQKAAARLHADHDHQTGKHRDLLCNNCNRGLGYFKDDPALLRAAAAYIDRHRAVASV